MWTRKISRREKLAAIRDRKVNEITYKIRRLRLTSAEVEAIGGKETLKWLSARLGIWTVPHGEGIMLRHDGKRQTLRQALTAIDDPRSDMKYAAAALRGCPVGGWGETDQAMRQIVEILPHRSMREYSLDDFVAAAYCVDGSERYRSRERDSRAATQRTSGREDYDV